MIKRAFNTRENIPSVRMFIGRVSKTNIGLRIAFTSPRTNAATRAAIKPSIVTPGRMYAAATITRVDISQLSKMFI